MIDTQPDPAPPPDPPPATEKPAPRRWWQLAEDNQRMLYITIVGGMAANVGLVLVVGLGLLEDRLIRRDQNLPGDLSLIQSVAALLLSIAARRQGSRSESKLTFISRRFGLALGILVGAVFNLAVVGYAAGIK